MKTSTLAKATLLLCSLSFSVSLIAGAGHDHGHDATPIVASPNMPQRLPDGSVFLPKPTQRFIKLRTQISKIESLPRTVKLNGRVIAGPRAIGKLYALQTGRLHLSDKVLPAVGEQVTKGQRLATITLTGDAQEGTNQAAEVAHLREQLKLEKLEHKRLQKLKNLIPQREIDTAAAAVRSIKARIAAFSRGAKTKEVLRVPMSGIVTGSYATNEQAVQAGDLILEIIDPTHFQVEALSFDPALTKNIASATMLLDKQSIPLHYRGSSRRLRLQALPLRFTVKGNALTSLAEGLPVQVFILTKDKQQGVAVPADALARNASNQSIVWVKTAPEQYSPRVVKYQPLDGVRVMVTAGLQGDERVVVQATTLLNQVR